MVSIAIYSGLQTVSGELATKGDFEPTIAANMRSLEPTLGLLRTFGERQLIGFPRRRGPGAARTFVVSSWTHGASGALTQRQLPRVRRRPVIAATRS
jgi:hypothetical protein